MHANVPVFTYQNHVLLEDTGSGYGALVQTSVSVDPSIPQVAVTESDPAGTGRFLMRLRCEPVGYAGYFIEDDFIVDVYDLVVPTVDHYYHNVSPTPVVH